MTCYFAAHVYVFHRNYHVDYWQELYDLVGMRGDSWIIVCDFNVTRWSWEKFHNHSIFSSMSTFDQWINDYHLWDICVTNRTFTWSSGGQSQHSSLLDRFPTSEVVIDKFIIMLNLCWCWLWCGVIRSLVFYDSPLVRCLYLIWGSGARDVLEVCVLEKSLYL